MNAFVEKKNISRLRALYATLHHSLSFKSPESPLRSALQARLVFNPMLIPLSSIQARLLSPHSSQRPPYPWPLKATGAAPFASFASPNPSQRRERKEVIRRHSKAFLDISGVKDRSKMVLLEDPTGKEKRLLEQRRTDKLEKVAKSISRISLNVDKLATKLHAMGNDAKNPPISIHLDESNGLNDSANLAMSQWGLDDWEFTGWRSEGEELFEDSLPRLVFSPMSVLEEAQGPTGDLNRGLERNLEIELNR